MNSYPGADRSAMLPTVIRIPILLLLLCAPLNAQSGGGDDGIGTGGASVIRGRVYLPSGPGDVRMKVRLESTDMANLTTITDVNGSFRFNGLQGGNYTIIIDGDDYYEPYRESISIEKASALNGKSARTLTVPVYLRLKSRRSPETAIGTVDASLAKVPQAAQDLYRKGLEASRKGDGKGAVDNLKAAVELYPEFALALNELGVQYLKLGKPDKAVEALRSALKLEPGSFMPRLNYGIALLENKEFANSETELRQALKGNDSSAVAHLYLGVCLVKQHRLEDAEKELERAVKSGRDDMSMGHYYLAGIYWGRREYGRAADALEAYLKLAPQAPDAERTRATIKELRSKK